MEPIIDAGEVIVRYWREVLIICLFFWGKSKVSEARFERKARIKQMYEYEACREIIPADKLFMWPTRYYDPQTDSYKLQELLTEEVCLQDATRR